jgi:dTDP-4-amino-4,6-dideoxygalactose transaminase
MEPILEIARRRGLLVIEDAAQAHGAERADRRAGSFGTLGCFSFYPGKNLGAYGEGGCVTTNDAAVAGRLRMLRDWGQDRKYNHALMGFNYRMDGIQGAVLGVKMDRIENWTEARRAAARRYERLLAGFQEFTLPREQPGSRHAFHLYALRVPPSMRDSLVAGLQERGIGCGLHYPIPIHLQPCLAGLGHRRGDFPEAEAWADEELSIPMFPEITPAQQEAVRDGIAAVLADIRAEQDAA